MDKLHLVYHLRLRIRLSNTFAMVMGVKFNDFQSREPTWPVTLYIALRCLVYMLDYEYQHTMPTY